MTRLCMDCKTELGEKCPRCGSVNLVDRGNEIGCAACNLIFTKGEGGDTHGLCEQCLSIRRAKDGETTAVKVRGATLLPRSVLEKVRRRKKAADPEQKGAHPVPRDGQRLPLRGRHSEAPPELTPELGPKTLYLGKLNHRELFGKLGGRR